MSTPGEDYERDELLAVINEYVELLGRMDEDEIRKDELAEWIAKRMAVGEKIEVADDVGVQLVAGARRFNVNLAHKFFTPEQLDEISVVVPSAALAHKLYPVLSELSKVAGKPSLRRL